MVKKKEILIGIKVLKTIEVNYISFKFSLFSIFSLPYIIINNIISLY